MGEILTREELQQEIWNSADNTPPGPGDIACDKILAHDAALRAALAAKTEECSKSTMAARAFNAEANKWIQELMDANTLLSRAARIMRRDGFTTLRGTLWNDGEGVEDIQSWDKVGRSPRYEPSAQKRDARDAARPTLLEEQRDAAEARADKLQPENDAARLLIEKIGADNIALRERIDRLEEALAAKAKIVVAPPVQRVRARLAFSKPTPGWCAEFADELGVLRQQLRDEWEALAAKAKKGKP